MYATEGHGHMRCGCSWFRESVGMDRVSSKINSQPSTLVIRIPDSVIFFVFSYKVCLSSMLSWSSILLVLRKYVDCCIVIPYISFLTKIFFLFNGLGIRVI